MRNLDSELKEEKPMVLEEWLIMKINLEDGSTLYKECIDYLFLKEM